MKIYKFSDTINTMKRSVIILCVFVLSICLVSAIHDISPSFFSVDEKISFLYDITVNNTDAGQTANITRVNVIIPTSFTFVEDSNGTDSLSIFTDTSPTLSWINLTEYVINGSEWKNFWFNAIASTLGNYNIIITTINATGTFDYNISVEVNDSTPLSIEFTAPTPTHNSNFSQSYIPINVTATGNISIDTIIIYLYNTTNLVSSETDSTSPFFTNFTGLTDGTYYINATVNDTSGNTDSTTTKKIILSSTILCTPDWHCTNWSECIGGIQIRSCVDFNNCEDISTKPPENQSCDCIPDWSCTEWQPKNCPKNETQTRTCEDLNNCGTNEGKPSETKSCTYKSETSLLLIIIVIVVIILSIIGIIVALIIRSKNKNFGKTNSSNQSPGGYPSPSQTPPRPPRSPPPLQRQPVKRPVRKYLPRKPIRRYLPRKPKAFQPRPRYSNKSP